MPVEVSRGFLVLRSIALALSLGLTMRKAAAGGANVLVATLSALARSAKIDQFSHRPRWCRMYGCPTCAPAACACVGGDSRHISDTATKSFWWAAANLRKTRFVDHRSPRVDRRVPPGYVVFFHKHFARKQNHTCSTGRA
jgi:hypothetical protein